MAYQHPLHYLLGQEGLALLRAYAGDWDREFAEARVAEIARLLADPRLAAEPGVDADEVDTVDGYRRWSVTYDEPGNGLFPVEEPFVHGIVGALPAGRAVDAACGTGRHAAHLADLGHDVIGVDSSPDMLARARHRTPGVDWRPGALTALPVPDDHADLVVCGLALAHLRSLDAAFAEFARVLRPGGHLVTTDIHPESVLMGSVPHVRSEDGRPWLIPSYRHRAGDYLGAALPRGFQVRACAEPRRTGGSDDVREPAAPTFDHPAWDGWPWSLHALTPGARSGAWHDLPATMMWHFQLGQ